VVFGHILDGRYERGSGFFAAVIGVLEDQRGVAAMMPPSRPSAHELLLRRARQAEIASHMSDWLNSPGLQSPK
jgi:hypothetical protein